MKKIAIEINCKQDTCHNRNHLNINKSMGFMCKVFCKSVTEKGTSFLRLPECKQAEVKDGIQ